MKTLHRVHSLAVNASCREGLAASEQSLIVTFFALGFHEKYFEKMKLYKDVFELVMIAQ